MNKLNKEVLSHNLDVLSHSCHVIALVFEMSWSHPSHGTFDKKLLCKKLLTLIRYVTMVRLDGAFKWTEPVDQRNLIQMSCHPAWECKGAVTGHCDDKVRWRTLKKWLKLKLSEPCLRPKHRSDQFTEDHAHITKQSKFWVFWLWVCWLGVWSVRWSDDLGT